MSAYGEKLKHPKWQKRRLEILERDGWKCTNCGNAEEELHVHHRNYTHGASPWEYSDDELTTLCHICHRIRHGRCPSCNAEYPTKWPCCLECNMMACRDPKTGCSAMMLPAADIAPGSMRDSISKVFKELEQLSEERKQYAAPFEGIRKVKR